MTETLYNFIGMGWTGLSGFILPFILVLSVLVFVHEWGHYIVARYFGVKVDVFSIGFGKELFGWDDKNGTRWKVSLIPLGGYVQMFGDTDPSSARSKDDLTDEGDTRPMTAEEKRDAFFTKPVYQRALIVFAGPAINFIFAFILLACLYMTFGKPVTPPVAAAIMIGSAGEAAGMQPHDRVVAIDGEEVTSFNDIQKQVAISLDRPLTLDILRDGELMTLDVTPQVDTIEDRFGFEQSRGLIGILSVDKGVDINSIISVNDTIIMDLSLEDKRATLSNIIGQEAVIGLPSTDEGAQPVIVRLLEMPEDNTIALTQNTDQEVVEYSLPAASYAAVEETWFIITGTLEALWQIITGTRSATELGGIVRIGAIAGDAAQNGVIALVTFTALLSINLGLINLFPIPLLDGGHLVFYAYESLFGKPMSEKVMDYALKFGMVFLVCLMLFANINDFVQIIL
jgi:regulator of sigma E protease